MDERQRDMTILYEKMLGLIEGQRDDVAGAALASLIVAYAAMAAGACCGNRHKHLSKLIGASLAGLDAIEDLSIADESPVGRA